jgi:succinoglycan biosynthesis protein ExoA
MPVRNEAAYIAGSLAAVLAQDYPRERMEVIVADGMSTDGTRELVELMQRNHPHVKILDNPGKIVPTGLNAALAEAQGEIIIRVDGHCKISKDYVRRCVVHIQHDQVDGVGGPVETVGETTIAQAISLAMSSSFGVGGSAFRTQINKTMLVDTVPFPAYTRRIIDRAGLYDDEQIRNQDDEYNYRLRKLGAKILLAADVRSQYFSRGSLGSLWRQYFQYGYWKVRVMQKHPRQMQPRQFVPAIFVGAVGLSLCALPFSAVGQELFVFTASAYAIANAGATIVTMRGESVRFMPLLPVAFATLHLAYGTGFLFGLIRFWNRWGFLAKSARSLRLQPQPAGDH